MPRSNRVVITGMGCVSSLGFSLAELEDALRHGRTGIQRITHLDTSNLRTTVGGTVNRDQLRGALQAIECRYSDITVDAGLLAADQALKQAGWVRDGEALRDRHAATLFGTGMGCAESYTMSVSGYFKKGAKGMRPTTVPRCMANALSSRIAIRYRLTGPNYVMIAACTSAVNAIGYAFRLVRDGYLDQALCGGADTIFEPVGMAAWDRLGMMTRRSQPETACRPFDRDRDGCVIGEGAAALTLESRDHALARGATPYAEIVGFGESSDARHLTTPDEQGQARAIQAALDDAGIAPDALGMINAHGTATVANDATECASVRSVLGASGRSIPMVSTKSYYGHLLGASGAIETVSTVLSLKEGFVPRNLNLDHPDEAAEGLWLTRSEDCQLQRPYALKNSFGFGGGNGVLVLRREQD